MPKEKTITPFWFEHEVGYAHREQIILLIDIHGPAAYGVHWLLQEFLAGQENYRASMRVVPGLIRKFNTTQAVMQAVLFDSGLYAFEGEEFFYSPELDHRLLKFADFRAKQAHRAQIGVLKKEEKRQKEIAELKSKLSEDDSIQPQNKQTNKTNKRKEIKNSLSSFECKKEEPRETFSNFKERIKRDFAGKVITNCVPGYRDGVELRLTGAELLQIHGNTLDKVKAAEIWDWLATNKHMVGYMLPAATVQRAELKLEYTGRTVLVPILGKPTYAVAKDFEPAQEEGLFTLTLEFELEGKVSLGSTAPKSADEWVQWFAQQQYNSFEHPTYTVPTQITAGAKKIKTA